MADRHPKPAHLVIITLAVAAGVVALWPSDKTDLASQALERQASLDLKVDVPPLVRLEGLEVPAEIEVSPADITVGHVDVPAATRMKVTFNSRQGFALQVNYDTAWVSRVDIWADGQPLRVDAPNAKVVVARAIGRDIPIELRYRLHLAPGARAGRYAWPISLAFGPVT